MFYMHLVNRKENGQLIPYLFNSNVKSVLLYGAEIWRKLTDHFLSYLQDACKTYNIHHVPVLTWFIRYIYYPNVQFLNHVIVNTKVISLKHSNSNVKSVLLYGAEIWRKTKAMLSKIQRFINYCLRTIMNIQWFDKFRVKSS
jgi:hypothetical protein